MRWKKAYSNYVNSKKVGNIKRGGHMSVNFLRAKTVSIKADFGFS